MWKVLSFLLGYNESKICFKIHFESTRGREVYKVYSLLYSIFFGLKQIYFWKTISINPKASDCFSYPLYAVHIFADGTFSLTRPLLLKFLLTALFFVPVLLFLFSHVFAES